jgi:serine/threonine protein phosphatase 1
MRTPRTFAIGDIHGDLAALDTLLGRLPRLGPDDTVVFLGDYVDRGPQSKQVIDRVRGLEHEIQAKVVALRGNHEDLWIQCFEEPNAGFLLPVGNGCGAMFRSFTDGAPLSPESSLEATEFARFIDVKRWLPEEIVTWMQSLPIWFEDDHAIYVHAALDGEGAEWLHPSKGRAKPVMWGREPDFFANYRGKTVVFGHTTVADLPLDHIGPVQKLFDDPGDVWLRGNLVGIDTGCGKGGFLSAIELPAGRVYESR